jgi:hypothetical protein
MYGNVKYYPADLQLALHSGIAHHKTIHFCDKQVLLKMIPRLLNAVLKLLH